MNPEAGDSSKLDGGFLRLGLSVVGLTAEGGRWRGERGGGCGEGYEEDRGASHHACGLLADEMTGWNYFVPV